MSRTFGNYGHVCVGPRIKDTDIIDMIYFGHPNETVIDSSKLSMALCVLCRFG